jgi:hypothetical protein
MATRYAGIAWTGAGYRVEVLDGEGKQAAKPSSWPHEFTVRGGVGDRV